MGTHIDTSLQGVALTSDLQAHALRLIRPFGRHKFAGGSRHQLPGLTPEETQRALFNLLPEEPLSPHEVVWLLTGSPAHVPQMGTPEYTRFTQTVFKEVFHRDDQSLDETTPERLRAAWRIVREMALTKNQVSHGEPLFTALLSTESDPNRDLWIHPPEIFQINRSTGVGARLIVALQNAMAIPEEEYPHGYPPSSRGLALLPPGLPQTAYLEYQDPQNYVLRSDYSPHEDRALMLFVQAVRGTAHFLGIEAGTPNDPDAGYKGMLGLLDPEIIRVAFPTRTQILAWEHLMTVKTMDFIVANGTRKTLDMLYDEFGLTPREQMSMLALARTYTRSIAQADIEEERSIMILRMEQYLIRTRESLDVKAEMNAMKQMSMVMGLTKGDTDNTMGDLIDVVRRASLARAPVTTLNAPTQQALPVDDD